MGQAGLPSRIARLGILTLAGGAAGIALLALVGTLLGHPAVAALGPNQVPMSPLGAVLVFLLAGGILLREGWSGVGLPRQLFLGLTLAVSLVCLVLVAGQLLGPPFTLGRWLFLERPPHQQTSLLTALALFGTSLGMLVQGWRPQPRWRIRQGTALLAQLPLVIGTLVLVSYAAGAPLLYETTRTPMSLPSALCAVGLGLSLVLAAGFDTWPLAVFGLMPLQVRSARSRGVTLGSIALFLLLGVIILSGGSFYLRGQLRLTRARVDAGLSGMADFKVQQIAAWHAERRAEAEEILQNPLLQAQLKRFLQGSPMVSEAAVRRWMEGVKRTTYQEVVLVDGRGRTRLHVGGDDVLGRAEPDLEERERALQARGALMSDLHLDGQHRQIHLNLWVPIGPRPDGRADGALFLRLDPHQFLYPLIQSWPTPSSTAETLLVRREGDEVVFLNDLRHHAHAALALRLPLAGFPDLPAARAVQGTEGLVTGTDYRGQTVHAALRRIPGTTWHMVAKVDEAEVYDPLRHRVWLTGAALIGLLALTAAVLGLMARHHEAELVRTQLALSQRFEALMREANDTILLMDGEGWIREANLRAEENYGYTLAELRTMQVAELRAPQSRAEVPLNLAQLKVEGATRFETIHIRRDGTAFPVEVSARLILLEGEPLVLSFIRDVTERVARDRELTRMTQIYAALMHLGQAIVWSRSQEVLLDKVCEVLVDHGGFALAGIAWREPQTGRVEVAAQYGDLAGFQDFLRRWQGPFPHPKGPVGMALQEGCPCVVNNLLAELEPEVLRQAALNAGFASAAAFPIRQGGQVVGALAVYAKEVDVFGTHEAELLHEAATDISFALDHLASEASRLRTEASLRKILVAVEQSPVSIMITDPAGAIEYVNPAFSTTTGFAASEVLGRNPRFLRSPDTPPEHYREMWQTLSRGQVWVGEFENLRKGGEPFLERATIAPVRDEQGTLTSYIAIKEDITRLRQEEATRRTLETQLHQSQKLESLGSLAGGVAHDMNNVLGAILGLASTLREGAPPSSAAARNLDTIVNACIRGRGVVKSLLYFAHKDLQDERPIDLNGLIQEMSQLLSYTLLKQVKLQMDLDPGLAQVRGDGGALSHALMNLCVNAMDAMPGGGTLHLTTAWSKDGGVELRVRDTGEGMAPEVLAKAMEPFFTTKAQGKGTGLGLAMVYGTMKAHDGTLELLSQPGQGTEAILRFPASRLELGGIITQPVPDPERPPQAALRILLVDDDELIRDSLGPLLELLGHTVAMANEGRKALDLLEAGLGVDLVILDMNMPGMGGREALPLIRALRPGLPVLMASGYSELEIAPLLKGCPGVSSLRKPFSLKEIKQKLADLDIRPEGAPGH